MALLVLIFKNNRCCQQSSVTGLNIIYSILYHFTGFTLLNTSTVK